MNPLLFYFVTPTLGLLRNYIKYKQLYIRTYLRTPLVYVFFHMWFCLNGYRDVIFRTLIYERWFWFIYKSWISYRNDDYNNKKQKHIKKGRVTFDLKDSE
jgi:hypothetical protein